MLNQPQKTVFLLCGILCLNLAQSVVAATPAPSTIKPIFKPLVSPASKLKPQKITSHKALANLLLKRHTNHFNRALYDVMPGGVSLLATDSGTTAKISHTETNSQVQGVDEADLVKVGDDGYIYQIYNNQVRIIKGLPISELNQEATLSFPDTNFYPSGLYIRNGMLVVTGSSWTTVAPEKT